MKDNNRILIVDDDPVIQWTCRQILTPGSVDAVRTRGERLFREPSPTRRVSDTPDYELSTAENGQQGIAAVEDAVAAGQPFAAAFVDMKMPGIDGAETIRGMWRVDPDLFFLIMTAYSDSTPDEIANISGKKDFLYLRKPFSGDEVRQLARSLTSQWNLRKERDGMLTRLRKSKEETEKLVLQRTRALKERETKLSHTLRQLRKALGATIEALSAAVEARDPYTAGHQRHVADLARAMGSEMGLSAARINGIRLAGAIHDIGKVRIPSEILSRPGNILSPEIKVIQHHPEAGYEILKNIDFPWPVAEIELQHHERLDGSGYPRGLKGQEILVEAKVIAVADVVDAMVSHRPYREGLGLDSALAEIEEGKGKRYDPPAVDACVRLFREKGFQFGGGGTAEGAGKFLGKTKP